MSKVLKIVGFVIAVLISGVVAFYAIQAYGSRSAAPARTPVSVLEGKVTTTNEVQALARRARRAAELKALQARRARRVQEAEARLAKTPHRRVRRFRWMSPAASMGERLALPLRESNEDLLTAFTRICIAEADGYLQDCVGIWQVMQNIRRIRCTRGEVRRITECEELAGQDGVVRLQETMISVMRRSQPHIMAMGRFKTKVRNRRAAWIRHMTTDCENPPRNWTGDEDQWDAQYGAKRCPYVVQLGEYLLKGKLPPDRPGVRLEWLPGRPITWGGDCSSGKASCDDTIACARQLARVKGGPKTHNAFWCRPGRGCSDDIDPICIQMGYPSLKAHAAGAGGAKQSDTKVATEREETDHDRGNQEAGAGDNVASVAAAAAVDGHRGAPE